MDWAASAAWYCVMISRCGYGQTTVSGYLGIGLQNRDYREESQAVR